MSANETSGGSTRQEQKNSIHMTDEQTRRKTSLRCLLSAMCNILIIDWLTGKGKEHTFSLTKNTAELDDVVNNIETFFLKDVELDKDEVRSRHIPLGSSSWLSILHSIFFEAVVQWNAAHLSVDRPDRYLDESMYSGEMLKRYRRFSKLPMPPLAYVMTQMTFDDFKETLVHSINIVSNSGRTFDEKKRNFADGDWSFVTQEVDDILR